MGEAIAWGAFSAGALLVGALVALRWSVPSRAVGLVLGFGAGVLISAVAFELVLESYDRAPDDAWAVALGLAAGALVYYAGSIALDHRTTGLRAGAHANEGGKLVLGALLDGIPESFALGLTLLERGRPSTAFVAAVFLSNLPEGLSATADLRAAGTHSRSIVRLWLLIVAASALAAGLGYALLDGAPNAVFSVIQAFAAGAVLQMLVTTMLPEALEDSGPAVGLVTVLGFTLSFYLSVG